MAKRKKLGEILVESGLLDEMQLNSALGHQRQWGGRLGEVLVHGGFATEDEIAECLAAQLDLPRIDIYESGVDPAAARLLPVDMVETNDVLPVKLEGEVGDRGAFIWVAVADPTNLPAIDEVQFRTGKRVRAVVVTPSQLQAGIRHAYHGEPLENLRAQGALGPQSEQAFSPDSLVHGGSEFSSPDEGELVLELDRNQPTMGAPTTKSAGDEDPGGRTPSNPEMQQAIVSTLEGIVAGKSMPKELQRHVSPTQMLSAIIRVLVRKGVCDVTELAEELQRS